MATAAIQSNLIRTLASESPIVLSWWNQSRAPAFCFSTIFSEIRYPLFGIMLWLPPGLQLTPALAPIPPAITIVAAAFNDDRLVAVLLARRHIGLARRQVHLALHQRSRRRDDHTRSSIRRCVTRSSIGRRVILGRSNAGQGNRRKRRCR